MFSCYNQTVRHLFGQRIYNIEIHYHENGEHKKEERQLLSKIIDENELAKAISLKIANKYKGKNAYWNFKGVQ